MVSPIFNMVSFLGGKMRKNLLGPLTTLFSFLTAQTAKNFVEKNSWNKLVKTCDEFVHTYELLMKLYYSNSEFRNLNYRFQKTGKNRNIWFSGKSDIDENISWTAQYLIITDNLKFYGAPFKNLNFKLTCKCRPSNYNSH